MVEVRKEALEMEEAMMASVKISTVDQWIGGGKFG